MKLKIGTSVKGDAFTIPLDLVTQTQAIVATKGKGKTYLAMVQTEEMLKAGAQVVCLDPTGVWWGLQADGTGKGFPIIIMGGEHGNVPLEPTAGEIVADFIVETGQSVILDLSYFESDSSQDRFVTAFAKRFYRLKAKSRTPVHLMLDEADSFCPQRTIKGQEHMLGAFQAIVRRGRSRGIGITLITQRPAVLNKNVLMMAELLTCLGIVGNIDQDAVDDWVKRYGTKAQRESFMATLASLPKGRAWFWSPAWLGCFTQVDVRKKLTFDSSKTPSAGELVEKPAHLAKPDLDKLTKQITATIERAKAEDPRELKRRIAELERKLKSGSAATKPCNHEPIIEKLRLREGELIAEVKRIGEELKVEGRRRSDLDRARRDALRSLQAIEEPKPNSSKQETKPLSLHPLQAPARIPQRTGNPGVIVGKSGADREPQMDADITRPQQRILDALARLETIGVIPADKVTVAVQAGVSNKSSAYGNNLGALRTLGLIDYPFSGAVALTDAGRKVADPGDPIDSLHEYHRQWLSMITRPQAAILGELIRIHPEPVDKIELAARIGVSDLSSAYGNNLGALRTMGAISYPQKGTVAATDLLFPEGLV